MLLKDGCVSEDVKSEDGFSIEDNSLKTQTVENIQPINNKLMPIDYNTIRPGPSSEGINSARPVSYTHLDVYKRQVQLAATCAVQLIVRE